VTPIDTDALVIGAGPVGLFGVFQLGLRELSAQVVDALPFAGGQCIELYADKPLYDIPALPACTGRELTERLLAQIRPMRAPMHLGDLVDHLVALPDGRWQAGTRAGRVFHCRAVLIAAGVGAFMPRTLKLDGLEAFEGSSLGHSAPDPKEVAANNVVIVGATEMALCCAITLAQARAAAPATAPASVTLVHRRDHFDADAATVDTFRALAAEGALRFVSAQATGYRADAGRLTALDVLGADGATTTLPLDRLLVLQGLAPRLGPIADWGLALERRQLRVDTGSFATSLPGVFAVGDVVSYPGKQRLIVSGFHEATLAAAGIALHIDPGATAALEYTTSSARIHRLLGVGLP